jgi:CheY-like chemotaxis protein
VSDARVPPPKPPVPPAPVSQEDLEEIEEFEVVEELRSKPPPPLPSIQRIAKSPGPIAPASKHMDPAAPVVLVADDDASIRAMIVRALGLTCTVYEAVDGQDAYDVLARIPPPACVVTDWMMPRMDGVELAKRIKADGKKIPVIFLTAKDKPLDVVQGINAGARHYIAKPFKMKELIEKVGQVVGVTKR